MQETPHYNTEISQKDIFQEKKKKIQNSYQLPPS